MPHYEFYCERCKKEVTLTPSIGERERGDYKHPEKPSSTTRIVST